jgi:hypothetical protein
MLQKSHIGVFWILIMIVFQGILSCSHEVFMAPMPTGDNKERTMAILPFEVVTKLPRMPRGSSLAKLKEDEMQDGYTFQRDLYRYFLRDMALMGLASTKLQDFHTTNQLIAGKGIQYEEIRKIPKQSLADILDVDGIISGYMVQRVSNEGNFLVGLLDGAPNANKIELVMTLHEKKNGDLLWKFANKGGAKGENLYELAKNLMREVPERFPLVQF